MSEVFFGDSEPEDAWHPDDPLDELVDNLIRRAVLLDDHTLIPRGNPVIILTALAGIVARARTRGLEGRALVRADELDEDIVYVRTRF